MALDELSEDSSRSRRRQQLLRPPKEPVDMFTMADVATLQNDRSAAARAQVARRLGMHLDDLSAGKTKELVRGILALLVRDVEREVRQSLAEAVAESRALPPHVAKELAKDDISVAEPILTKSPALSDDVLVEIVRTHAMQYALAVAGREQVSEQLSEALVDRGEECVVAKLVGNLGAKLSERTMHRVIEDYADSADVRDRLVRRPSLPPAMIEELVGLVLDRLTFDLIDQKSMNPAQARVIVEAVRERASIDITAREHGDHQRLKSLRMAMSEGRLEHDDLLLFLREGDVAGFELGMAIHADLSVADVRRLTYNPDRRYLAGLCARAEFSTPHYITLRMALELAEATVANTSQHRGYTSEAIHFLQKQYDRLKQNELEVEELIYGE